MKTLETERLLLREWQVEDANDVYAYAKSELVGPRAGWKPHTSVDESKEIIAMFIRAHDTLAIVNKQNNTVVGSIGLHKTRKTMHETDFELGYVLSEDYWGQGIIPEAAKAVIAYAKEELGCKRMLVAHFPGNEQSKRVIEKLGFTYAEKQEAAYQRYDGVMMDEFVYTMDL